MNYFVFGTNNMNAAESFYDSLFLGMKFQKMSVNHRMTYWLGEDFAFAIAIPFDENCATNGNGTMVGFCVDSTDEVKRLYHKALELGGKCEGVPNQRGPKFSAYVRDLDNNKICISD